ncbi:hypothetical protein N5J01_01210 [Stenotrophomonas sp. GD03701]|uniref:hypothetical protein n=2 Tax=Stenotrophomonas TaxID=40323 RepID=UPI000A88E2DA|nr:MULTISPECIES: hypothetical protein [Stenotrophomonas]MDH1387024.1 hypothetical protein [Stenotrophomonas sp. GD03701]
MGSALQFRHIQPIPRSEIFQHGGWQVVRAILIGAMLVASTPAWAEPSPAPLQIRLTVVEACRDDPGSTHCPAPHQRSDAPQLPPQVRELAPPADDEDSTSAVTVIY